MSFAIILHPVPEFRINLDVVISRLQWPSSTLVLASGVSHCVGSLSKAKLAKYESSGGSAPKHVIMAYKGLGSKVPCTLTKVHGEMGKIYFRGSIKCVENNSFHVKIALHSLLLHIREVPSSNLVPKTCYLHWGFFSGRTIPKTRSSFSECDFSWSFYNSTGRYINRKSE
jgi:hypothetical protein